MVAAGCRPGENGSELALSGRNIFRGDRAIVIHTGDLRAKVGTRRSVFVRLSLYEGERPALKEKSVNESDHKDP